MSIIIPENLAEGLSLIESISYKVLILVDFDEFKVLNKSNNIYKLVKEEDINAEDYDKLLFNILSVEDLYAIRDLLTSAYGFIALKNGIFSDYFLQCGCQYVKKRSNHLIDLHITPVEMFVSEGLPKIYLVALSISPEKKRTFVRLRKKYSGISFVFKKNRWIRQDMPTLTSSEKDVIFLSLRGYKISEISELMCRTEDTIKSIRRKIFEKLEVSNIAQAQLFAQNQCLI